MNLSTHLPAPRVLARSAIAVVAIAVPVGLIWLLLGESTAMAAWLGIAAMFLAILHLPLGRQVVIGLSVGLAAGAGAMVEGDTLLLSVVIVVACLAQWRFNQWSTASGALVPPMALYYWEQAAEQQSVQEPWQIVLATWLGIAIVMGIAAAAKLSGAERPAGSGDAARHAIGLAVGCVALVVLISAFDLPRGFWGILTLCLVYRPTYEETTTKVRQRTVGTVIGAVVAVGFGLVVPQAAIMAVAVVSAVLAVAYTLTHDYLRYSVFLTLTIVLMFGAGEPVFDLAEERAGMTLLGAAIAMAMTLLTAWLFRPGRDAARADGSGTASGTAG